MRGNDIENSASSGRVNELEHFELKIDISKNRPKDIELILKFVGYKDRTEKDTGTYLLKNKKAEYNKNEDTYTLIFRGRAQESSPNNIQMIRENGPSEIVLYLGKMQRNDFALDFTYPFTMMSAFGFAVSCFLSD